VFTGDGNCVCSINKEAAETKCICIYHEETGERDISVIDCGEPVPTRRAKRAILPVADPLPASESEEGDKPKPKHGQDATAPVNGKDQLITARRATLKRLHRSADNRLASNDTNCYKPNWCDCLCKKVGAKDNEAEAYDCTCGDMPEWNCAVTNAQEIAANTRTGMSSCVCRMSSHCCRTLSFVPDLISQTAERPSTPPKVCLRIGQLLGLPQEITDSHIYPSVL